MRIGYLLRALLHGLVIVAAHCTTVSSQIKWDGGGGDGQWTTAANWTSNILPTQLDDVVLDNSFITGNYTVSLPSGNVAVSVKTISITPTAGRTIELILPPANTSVPAFTTAGPGYGITINSGGIFRNASGADSSLPLVINDSLRINNGGRFIQNTERSHAATVLVLSKAPGTEEGIFEFDIPSASNTISLSGRSFGKLIFSSNAMPGIVTYTATGTNGVTVNSDLQIGEGVTFSLNLSDTMHINRDLVQQGGTINLGNASRKLVTTIGRHMIQSATGMIGKTGSAIPELIFNGNLKQQIDCKGSIQNNIVVTLNNKAGAELLNPLKLPYLLQLQQGVLITTYSNLLTMAPGASITADSLSGNSFINGPVRIETASTTGHYLLPLGKDNTMRWLALKNANGNFTAEFIKANPRLISTDYSSGIDHISQIEYWSLQTDAYPGASAAVELSFNDPNSGGVTDLSALRVAYFNGTTWMNAGNTNVTGTAGSHGSVVSNVIGNIGTGPVYFTLASSIAGGNPLPLREDTVRPLIRNNTNDNFWLRLLSYSSSSGRLVCRSPEKTKLTILVHNLSGTLVKVMTVQVEKGNNSLLLYTKDLPAGVYYISAFSSRRRSNALRFCRL